MKKSNPYLSAAAVLPMAAVLAACGTAEAPAPPAAAPASAPAAPPPRTQVMKPAPDAPHWDYGTEHGPAAWGSLDPAFSACKSGKRQSPIDIAKARTSPAAPVRASYARAALRIVHHEHVADGINNGHTIQINYPGADTLTVGDEDFTLVQYHFHAPSEHALEGKHFPMEVHFVHKSAAGKLAVVGVLVQEGAHNAAFDPVWANLPGEKGVETHLEHVNVDVDDLLPADRSSYRYQGSLTTPPCSEGVQWFVLATPISLSAEQTAAFTKIVKGNNRPTQPLNGRPVVLDRAADKAS